MRRGFLLVMAVAAVLAATAAVVLSAVSRENEPNELLPNLDQAAPGDLSGRTGGTSGEPRFFFGFTSAAGNVGEGPLVVDGTRGTVREPGMRLVQHIDGSDGSKRTVNLGATLKYFASPTHSHWHLLGFMRYELRAADGRRVRRDRKAGFCLGDRYRLQLALDGTPTSGLYTDECGKNQTKLLKLREGISVGWGDDYKPHLEGQEFDVTTLDSGRYVLIHRVNPGRMLRESDYSDNAASMAFDLSWPRGRKLPPRVDVVARCPATATCP
jgi:lysyl oxidase